MTSNLVFSLKSFSYAGPKERGGGGGEGQLLPLQINRFFMPKYVSIKYDNSSLKFNNSIQLFCRFENSTVILKFYSYSVGSTILQLFCRFNNWTVILKFYSYSIYLTILQLFWIIQLFCRFNNSTVILHHLQFCK